MYTVRVSSGADTAETTVEVLPDPRVPVTAAETLNWVATQKKIAILLEELLAALDGAMGARSQMQALQAKYDDAQLQDLTAAAVEAINGWESEITELRHETFEDEDAWVMKLDGQLRHLLDSVAGSGAPVTAGAMERFADLEAMWSQLKAELQAITADHLDAINRWADEQSIPYIGAPPL